MRERIPTKHTWHRDFQHLYKNHVQYLQYQQLFAPKIVLRGKNGEVLLKRQIKETMMRSVQVRWYLKKY